MAIYEKGKCFKKNKIRCRRRRKRQLSNKLEKRYRPRKQVLRKKKEKKRYRSQTRGNDHGIDQEKEQVFRPYFFSFLRKISL